MKLFMVGGTGLLGSEGARQFIALGHTVTTLALPEVPLDDTLPKEMTIIKRNYLEISDGEIYDYLKDTDAFIFAAGIDDRVSARPPVYQLYKKYNIDPVDRFLRIAKEVGVKHCLILGSYFAYFDKQWPRKKLAKHNPYIRSRVDQETVALSYADGTMSVAILELPYIFGIQKGRRPVWTILIEQILAMKEKTMYPKGGTTMVTVRQVGQAMVGALFKTQGGKCYPIGYYNMTWMELLRLFHKGMGCPDKKIVTIPTFVFALAGKNMYKKSLKEGQEPGLNMGKFASAFASNMFIDKDVAVSLGVTDDDIKEAIITSVTASMEAINGADLIYMKVEEKEK